jgi:uncharacterized protein YndB with AHSA1/START domain
VITWRLHLSSPPEAVHRLLATGEGRARFWAESAAETAGRVEFRFPNDLRFSGLILDNDPPRRFAVEYFGEHAAFDLASDGAGGTDLTLTDTGDDPDVRAGWVSVLMALKAAADFGVDLRNHDPGRTWDHGFADN